MTPTATSHARDRAMHRFGVRLDEPRITEIVGLIEGGDAIYYRPAHLKRGVHIVSLGSESAGVVFDPAERRIVTVMRVKAGRRG